MSFAHTHSVLLNSDLTKGQKLVLGVIGTFTDQGGKCWPAIETIAFRCAMCVRTVQGHINDLVKLHYLTRTLRIGRSAIIQLTQKAMGWLTGTPAEIAPPPPQKLHPEPVIEPINQITAQPAAPVLAENPAGAAIVVFESVDTEVMDTAPVVDLVADPLPVVDLVQAVDAPAMPNAPIDPLAAVPASLMKDFGDTRRFKGKAPKVPLLERQVLAREAAKARLTVEDVVKLCILRGWSHFEAVFATPVVMASFYAQMGMDQAPATPVKRVNQTESAPPASPEIVEAERAKIAALRTKIVGTDDPLAWAKQRIADYEAGKHVSGFALRAARAALRL
jgi:hypothetical protein